MSNKDYVISLFSGAGGMSLGFYQAGIKPVLAADIDADACATYRANLNVDAMEVNLEEPSQSFVRAIEKYRGAFALIGGPPCQGFSSAGNKDSNDPRNQLIFRYLSLVASIAPRWFLFENVEGLLTSNDGESIRDLVREFVTLGYRVRLEKVNFASFGLAQCRKRVVLIGNRLGMDFSLPVPICSYNAGKHKHLNNLPFAPSFNEAVAGLGGAIEDPDGLATYTHPQPVTDYDRLMREGNQTGSISLHFAAVSPELSQILPSLHPGQTMKDLGSEHWHASFKRRAFRRVMDGTPTEKRGGAPSGIKRLVGNLNALTITSAATREFIHPVYNRPLTMRECARLQSFPDYYLFKGSPTSVSRQIGNAFPPLVAKLFAQHLVELDGSAGANVSGRADNKRPGLLAYHLTDAGGMSPALERTDSLLQKLVGYPAQASLVEVA